MRGIRPHHPNTLCGAPAIYCFASSVFVSNCVFSSNIVANTGSPTTTGYFTNGGVGGEEGRGRIRQKTRLGCSPGTFIVHTIIMIALALDR